MSELAVGSKRMRQEVFTVKERKSNRRWESEIKSKGKEKKTQIKVTKQPSFPCLLQPQTFASGRIIIVEWSMHFLLGLSLSADSQNEINQSQPGLNAMPKSPDVCPSVSLSSCSSVSLLSRHFLSFIPHNTLNLVWTGFVLQRELLQLLFSLPASAIGNPVPVDYGCNFTGHKKGVLILKK